MIKSLYVHIPFCSSICSYCDFCKLIYNDKFAFSYIEKLKEEIKSYKLTNFKTIYIGGGTPSTLSNDLLDDLLSFLKEYGSKDFEFTIEVNPESINKDKLLIMKKHGINRISIGMQTTSNEYLKLLNRPSFTVFENAYKLIVETGFKNINIDLMYALPNEKEIQVIEDLKYLISLMPSHISTYSLILEENSIFGKKGYKEESQDVQANQYELILKILRDAGYRRYEVSNYCLPGFESKHNLTYWNNEEYVCVGLGASGYVNGIRYTNTKSLSNYLKNEFIDNKEKISKDDLEQYFLITHLRLEDGFKLEEYENTFGVDFREKHNEAYKKNINNYLLIEENGTIKASDKGILLLDQILLDLI